MARPHITFSVQKCARFYHAPKQDHEEAVNRICYYLLSTRTKGLILGPNNNKGIECYVDVD